MVSRGDPRFLSLIKNLHYLREKMNEEPSDAPEHFRTEAENPESEYIQTNQFVRDSLNDGHVMCEFRLEKSEYRTFLIGVMDSLVDILPRRRRRGLRPLDIFNAWKHIWNDPRNPEFKDVLPKSCQIYIKTSSYTSHQWLRFAFEQLRDADELPEELVIFENFVIHIAQHGVLANAIKSKRQDLLSGLDSMPWSSYVRVKDQRSGEFADDRICRILRAHNVVEINGYGGLGKTELLYQFLRRHLGGDYGTDLPDFQEYIILTAKSEEQGEVKPEAERNNTKLETTSPRAIERGPRSFVRDLRFGDVVRIINTYDMYCEDLQDVENAKHVINRGKFLLALDNFEDCRDEDRESFAEFFNDPLISKSNHSRVVITGRDNAFDTPQRIVLEPLQPTEAQELFRNRYAYLYNAASKNELGMDWVGYQRVLNGFNQSDFAERFEELCKTSGFEQFQYMVGHPFFIFYLTFLLGDQSIITEYAGSSEEEKFDLIGLLRGMIEDEEMELNLLRRHELLHEWIIAKAFRDVEKDDVAIFVLKQLLQRRTTLSEEQLRQAVSDSEHDWNTVYDFDRAMHRLEKHEIFIRRTNPLDGSIAWQLKPDGERFLRKIWKDTEDLIPVAPSTDVEKDIQDHLTEIERLLYDQPDQASEKIDVLVKDLNKTSLAKRQKLTVSTFGRIEAISALIRNEENRPNWRVIHNQAVSALMAALSKNSYPVGGDRPKTLSLFTLLLVDSEFTDSEQFWDLITTEQSLLWLNPAAMKNGRSEMFRHKLVKLLNDEREDVTDWARWCAFYRLVCPQLTLDSHHWSIVRNYLLSDQNAIRNLLYSENQSTHEHMNSYLRHFVSETAIFDEDWELESFQLLQLFEAHPTEPNWTNLNKWKRYTIPPLVPEDMAIHPSSWNPPTGLSFNHYLDSSTPVFQEVGDVYATYKDDMLGKTMTVDREKNEDTDVNMEHIDNLGDWAIEWLSKETQHQDSVDIKNMTGPMSDMLKKRFRWEEGPNRFLQRHSRGKYQSVKVWVVNFLIMDDRFLREYEHIEQLSGLGKVTRRNKLTEQNPPSRRTESQADQGRETPADELLSIFTNTAPQFPNIQTTLEIINSFIEYVRSTSPDTDSVHFANRYLKHIKKSGHKSAPEVTMGFGIAFNLSSNERITKNHVLDAINKNGRHRIEKMMMKNDQHKAREHELSVLLQTYMADLAKLMEEFEFSVVRNRTKRERNLNPLGGLVEVSRTMARRVEESTSPKPKSRIVDEILNAWVQKCITEFPDISIEKHLRSVLKDRRIKIKTLEKFLQTRDDVNSTSVDAFYALLEQGRVDKMVPSYDELIGALLDI